MAANYLQIRAQFYPFADLLRAKRHGKRTQVSYHARRDYHVARQPMISGESNANQRSNEYQRRTTRDAQAVLSLGAELFGGLKPTRIFSTQASDKILGTLQFRLAVGHLIGHCLKVCLSLDESTFKIQQLLLMAKKNFYSNLYSFNIEFDICMYVYRICVGKPILYLSIAICNAPCTCT